MEVWTMGYVEIYINYCPIFPFLLLDNGYIWTFLKTC
jgi:hypothetical protein